MQSLNHNSPCQLRQSYLDNVQEILALFLDKGLIRVSKLGQLFHNLRGNLDRSDNVLS